MSDKPADGKVIDFQQRKMAKMGMGALIVCPCGVEHLMALSEKRTCSCGRFYGYVEDKKALEFLASLSPGFKGDGALTPLHSAEESRAPDYEEDEDEKL